MHFAIHPRPDAVNCVCKWLIGSDFYYSSILEEERLKEGERGKKNKTTTCRGGAINRLINFLLFPGFALCVFVYESVYLSWPFTCSVVETISWDLLKFVHITCNISIWFNHFMAIVIADVFFFFSSGYLQRCCGKCLMQLFIHRSNQYKWVETLHTSVWE